MIIKNRFILHVFAVTLLGCLAWLQAGTLTLSLSHVDASKDGKPNAFVTNLTDPFVVNVTASDVRGNIDIKKLNNFHILGQNRSSSTRMINGQTSSQITHHITAQAIKEGVFEIGPATINENNTTISSNTISLTVDAQHQALHNKNQQNNNASQGSLLYKISVDKDRVAVGEPLVLTTSFYVQGPVLEFASERPIVSDFTTKEIKGSSSREEVVNGITYRVEEKKTTLIPQQEGTYTIPPVKAQYAVPPQKKRRPGGFFDDDFMNAFFGQQAEQRVTVSNELTIHVSPLPETNLRVDGVGNFTTFSATISKTSAQAHEPIILSLDLHGSGDLEHIAVPRLILPHDIKYFESKNELFEDASAPYAEGKKHFEFILQITRAGHVVIPSQAFTYYNTQQKKFETLKTNPITLAISPSKNSSQPAAPLPETPAYKDSAPHHDSALDQPTTTQDIYFIQEDMGTMLATAPGLPWWVFFILLLLPLLCIYHTTIAQHCFGRWINRYQANKSLSNLDKTFATIIQRNDACALYQFFLKFLAERFNTSISLVNEEWIEQTLKNFGLDDAKIYEFLDFMGSCAQLHFSHHQAADTKIDLLMKQAHYWHVMLNK